MPHTQSREFSSGFTLVEMLIGVAVVGVIVAAAVPSFTDMIERRRVVAAAGEISSFFAQARAESAIVTAQINLHLEPVPADVGDFSCLRLSTMSGTDTCTCDAPEDEVCSFGQGKLLREYVLPRSKSVRFDATGKWGLYDYIVPFQHGNFPTDVSNVRVTVRGLRTNSQLRVEYNNAGRVRTCSPDGSISGFPACG